MAAPSQNSSQNSSQVQGSSSPHNTRALSYNGNGESSRAAGVAHRAEMILRREHSDGDVLGTSPDLPMRSRTYGNASFVPGPAKSLLIYNANTEDAGQSPPAERRSGIAADIAAGRQEITEDYARRSWATHRSSRTPGPSRIEMNPREEYPLAIPPGRIANPSPSRDLNRHLPRRPSREHLPDRRSREIILPRWQPDAEVNECPICHIIFTFWFRKHHCRKCGRVVCTNCSPHRITIPRQFIVHPPEDATPNPESTSNARPSTVDLTGDDETSRAIPSHGERPQTADYKIDPALGGGQEVRLCNPCVPDPNPMPLPSYYPPNRASYPYPIPNQMPFGQEHSSQSDHSTSLNHPNSTLNRSLSGHTHSRSNSAFDIAPSIRPPFSATIPFEAGSSSRRHSHQPHPLTSSKDLPIASYGSVPDQRAQERQLLEDLVQRRRLGRHPHHRQYASINGPPMGHTRPYRSEELDLPSPRPVPQPQLREEDECPICHGALPPKGADGSETAREAHVSGCIETHFSSSTPRAARPHPSTAVDAAVSATTATPSQAGAAMDDQLPGSSSHVRPSSTLFQQRRRTTGMVVYHATEKDCVGEDGGEAECVICFEEFAVGDEMGRLECLCKFHKVH